MSIRQNGNILAGLPATTGTIAANDTRPVSGATVKSALDALSATIPSSAVPEPLTGSTAPTGSTVGALGQLYKDTVTGKLYVCSNVDDSGGSTVYTWDEHVALDANGLVPSAELPKAATNSLGIVKISAYGTVAGLAIAGNTGELSVRSIDTQHIDARNGGKCPICTDNLDYAVRSVLPNVTTIPAATSAYSLLDASAMTNSHSFHYQHAPTSAPTYTLPAVTQTITADNKVWTRNTATDGTGYYGWLNGSTNRYTAAANPGIGENTYTNTSLSAGAKAITENGTVHEIILDVDFTTVQSCSFEDASGNAVALQKSVTIASGDQYRFICEHILSEWKVFPLKLEPSTTA